MRHIDALFGEPGRSAIDGNLIERHYDVVLDMGQVRLAGGCPRVGGRAAVPGLA